MQTPYTDFIKAINDLFKPISDIFQPLGIPFGGLAWFMIITVGVLVLIIIFQFIRGRRAGGGTANVTDGIQKIIASTGDVSSGMAGAKKLKFLKTPSDALVFLKIEENAIQQALSAIDYYAQQGEISESMKEKFITSYQTRLETVRAAAAKDEQIKEMVDTGDAIDRARSDYLRKLAAMSGTEVEADTTEGGPTSVGVPGTVSTGPAVTPTAPSGGAPTGGAPSGGPPAGGPPGGGPPSGGAPGGGPPGAGVPSGPPSGGAPGGGPPGGGAPGDASPSGGPPGGGAPGGGPPGAGVPSGPPTGGAPSGGPSTGGKSSLQSEMLAEMERLKALMSGD